MSSGTPAEDIEILLQSGYRYALSLTHNSTRAEDILQDAWYAVLHAGGPHNKPYIFQAIRSRFINQYKRDLLVPLVPLDDINEEDYSTYDTPFHHQTYNDDALEQALSSLRTAEREALYLTAVEGYTAQEVAELTSQPRGTILSMLHRSRVKIRKYYQTIDTDTAP